MRISSAILKALLADVKPVITGRSPMPVMNMVRIEAKGGLIRLTGGTPDVQVTAIGEAEGELKACIEPGRLQMAAAAGSEVDINLKDGKAEIKAGRARYTVAILPMSDYLLRLPIQGGVTIECDDLPELIQRVVWCAGEQPARPTLNGVFLSIENGEIHAVATDGISLAAASASLPGVEPISVILRAETARMIADGKIANLTVMQNAVFANSDELEISSATIAGQYIDWRRTIPNANTHIVADRAALREAVSAISSYANETLHRAAVVELTGGQMRLSTTSKMHDEAAEATLDAEGPDHRVAFGARIFSEVIGNVQADTVRIGWDSDNDAISPRLVEDGHAKYIFMPFRL